MILNTFIIFGLLILILTVENDTKVHSIARIWNEQVLSAIRLDYARPTVHARNLYHTSIAMYDSWSIFDDTADTYLLGKTIDGFHCPYKNTIVPEDKNEARKEVISYAMYRIIEERFRISPGAQNTLYNIDTSFKNLGYEKNYESKDYNNSSFAALGNYIGDCIIRFGYQDGSNEINGFESNYYKPINPPLDLTKNDSTGLVNLNHWQPLTFEVFIDQSGNIFPGFTPRFVGPEWGNVKPFSLDKNNLSIKFKNGNRYKLYHDPGPPPYLTEYKNDNFSKYYKWGFVAVPIWSSHLDPNNDITLDISPSSIGNIENYPNNFFQYKSFYDYFNGGDNSSGHRVNPRTGKTYEKQIVLRSDYTRVLAEFWADGPESETPPGHWYVILNYVSDHPKITKKFRGKGEVLDNLEWDVKSYFSLGGAVHDAAISAWSIKGYYDYIRPISAIRGMAEIGQSTNPELPRYHPKGIPLIKNYIELVDQKDDLAKKNIDNVGKIKLYSWSNRLDKLNDNISSNGWILAEKWSPYQRSTFVTPPFAGYISGHSTFSNAAAEILTQFTGDNYFPGGIAEFTAKENQFLTFEKGPSKDIILQWATYHDAADQCSLSRIWGGIHPLQDDLPGRIIGRAIGNKAFNLADQYFSGKNNN